MLNIWKDWEKAAVAGVAAEGADMAGAAAVGVAEEEGLEKLLFSITISYLITIY